MPLALVQTTPEISGTGSSITFPFPSAPAIGNGIIVQVFGDGEFQPSSISCGDTSGNFYGAAVITGPPMNIPKVAVFFCSKITASNPGFAVTVSSGGGLSAMGGVALDVTGVGDGLAVDRTARASGFGTGVSTGTTAPVSAAEVLAVALHTINTDGSSTVSNPIPPWIETFELILNDQCSGEGNQRVLPAPFAFGTEQDCFWNVSSSGDWAAAIVVFRAQGVSPNPITITPATLPNPQTGIPYSQQLTATGGNGGPFIFSLPAPTLPPGLSLSPTGLISGTIAEAPILSPLTWPSARVDTRYEQLISIADGNAGGTWGVTVHAADGVGNTEDQFYELTIVAGSLTSATYRLTAGTLPGCVRLQTSGLVTGPPMTVGTWVVTVAGTTPGGAVLTRTYTLTVTS